MLHIHYSNRLEHLFNELYRVQAQSVNKSPSLSKTQESLASVLEPSRILVQSQGMARWISIQMAKMNGIAANIHYPYPASYLWSVLTQQIHGLPERSSFDKNLLQWRIMKLLPDLIELPEFEPLRQYLKDDIDVDAKGVKVYQLAGKVADIFDQYLVYRPDWIQQWEQSIPEEVQSAWNMALSPQSDAISTPLSNSDWQEKLWRELVKSIVVPDQAESAKKEWHRARLAQAFLTLAQKDQLNTDLFPDTLHVFGVSVLPPVYLQLFQVIAKTSDVHLYVMNPSLGYWGDLVTPNQLARLRQRWQKQGKTDTSHAYDSGNDLLVSMGKQGQEYQVLLQELIQDSDAIEHDAFDEVPDETSLLGFIQRDILQLENRYLQGGKTPLTADQLNIRIHDCHSPMREVEVLHDQLLHCFEENPELNPHDIVVMVPDVDSYSPYIHAVFGTRKGSHYIPFSVADRHGRQEHPILEAFFQLLSLSGSDFALPDVLSLLNVKAVQNRFQFEDIPKLTQWITQANIRWGLNREQRREKGVKTTANTWCFGIQRMLMGYLYGDLDETLYFGEDSVSPLVSVEGNLANDVGRLAQLIDSLSTIEDLSSKKTIEEWKDVVFNLLEAFFIAEGDDETLLQIVRDVMTSLYENMAQAQFFEPIHFAIIQDYLERHVGEMSQGQHFLSGQVSFCTLMPMRAIPFKVIALMGLNDSDYPRRQPRLGFDLMAKDHRKGDRSRREDDRYLFLEALLSARMHLHISYIGRSIRDNAEKQPSVLVSELLDYANASFCLSTQERDIESQIVIRHPLQPFNPVYFNAENAASHLDQKIQSFNAQWLASIHKLNGQKTSKRLETQDLFAELDAVKNSGDQSFIPFYGGPIQIEDYKKRLSQCEFPAQLAFDELKLFFTHPAKFILRKKMGIELYNQFHDHEKTEIYQLDGLQNYHYVEDAVGKILADVLLKEDDLPAVDLDSNGNEHNYSSYDIENRLESYLNSLVSQGRLPYSAFGTLSQKALKSHIQQFIDPIIDADYKALDDIELKLNLFPNTIALGDGRSMHIEPVKLVGWLKNHFQEGAGNDKTQRLVQWRYSKISGKNLLNCWLDHLAFCAQKENVEPVSIRSHYYARDQKVIFKALNSDTAIAILNEYVGVYMLAQQYWLPVFPKSGWEYYLSTVERKQENPDEQAEAKSRKIALDSVLGTRYTSGEFDDWYQYLYRDKPLCIDALFCQIHMRLFQPIYQYMEQEGDKNSKVPS